MNPLLNLKECGQSYWLDNLTRGKIQSGEIERRIKEEGLMGITSNPAIFQKAISSSDDYEAQITKLAKETSDVNEVYEAIVIQDIQSACDVLKQVYDETDGVDGYVSLEVSPHLARDTEGTMKEVRRFYEMVNRPNVLIKIPGTIEGVPAIEEMLYEGISINVTLLFSVKTYEAVAKAYIRAMKKRKSEGKSINQIASVASFFLSRIDVLVDKLLTEKNQDLLGKVAIANAKMAYQSFLDIFSGSEWEKLAAAGCKVQRPLWASTSTKNPDYNDVMYVEPLIGQDTVNTMPDETIQAFADHGVAKPNTILQNVDESKQILKELDAAGIDLDAVTDQLVDEGIKKFNDPFDKLMKRIEEEMSSVKQK